MRDIKFRVWDKETKHMHICGEDVHDTINFEIETNRAYYYNLQNGCGSLREDSDYVLMQYTGLKDKNGKEIYEGDILLAPEWFGSLECVCIYQQENIVNPIQGFGLYSYDSYFKKYNTLVESDEWDEFEVIGNIYDNLELLEEGEKK